LPLCRLLGNAERQVLPRAERVVDGDPVKAINVFAPGDKALPRPPRESGL
jgi:hypothetical protein